MILIALGANLPSRFGSPAETIDAAYKALEDNGVELVKKSRVWLTAPVPVSDQPWFHNAVAEIKTELDAFELLSLLHKVEAEFGRERFERNEPRIIDLDLIAYHDQVVERPSLIVPHPRLHERAFVLLPLQDIAPDWVHPISGIAIAELLEKIPVEQKAEIL